MNEQTEETETKVLAVTCASAANVNVAFYQNAVPIIRDLAIENKLGSDLSEISVRLTAEPPFLTPGVWRIERIADRTIHHIRSLDLKLDPAFLAGINASRRGELRIQVEAWGAVLAEQAVEINLLPPSHWGGVNSAPELLAAFVRPTDPSVDVILREASDKLAAAGRDEAMDGYRKGTKARAWEIADAIWAALVSHSIAYVLPPKSFERSGQMVRGPSDILSRKVGTCLDLTLLYASCLEQAGLNPILVLTEGHAFVGVWLVEEDFSGLVVDDPQMLRKRVQLEEMVVVETTLMTGAHPARFKQAVEAAKKLISEDATSPFEVAIDVRRARAAKIRPLDLSGSVDAVIKPVTAAVTAQEVGEIPQFEEELDKRREPVSEKNLDRLEVWKRNLLDLSLKNRLLNFKGSKSTIAIECPDPAMLEDKLSGGDRFKLLGKSSVLDGSDGREAALLAARQNEDARKDFIVDAMKSGELHTSVADTELEGRLTDLYRASRLAFEEGGANILYLCLGFLEWTPEEGAGPYRAPLILVPVQLERESVRSGFRLALHEDEARFNPTLLQMLKQDFDLSMPEFDDELPQDASGIDVAAIWKTIRQHIKSIKGWEVTEQVTLATLSFTKYLMWKDLIDRTDLLKRNKVVAHLIDTPTHTYDGSGAGFIDARTIDQVIDPVDLFAPLSADSSQIAAIVAAQRGSDFVLFGPPGTGKSQTIANAITNCLAHGKTVLFVSQKTAALEVVRQRMQAIGLGNYCLEVHSTKAQKSSVLEQLATAWRERNLVTEEHWSTAAGDLKKKRDQLNRLVSALHRRRSNGMTAYEAFGRVIADRDRLAAVDLTWPAGTVHSPEDLASTVQSQQSILDECLASNIPSMRLSWHYRSRHESLIAFSNAKYYRGELMTFPSPVTRDTAVRYVHVEGGIYERGGAKVNRKEAEAVVSEVVKRLKTSSHSIGVVTFNGDQQRLIENMLDQARRSDPSLEAHFDRNQTREPILVKNIENVQGDERDVIIFSVAVGHDKTGRITAQISSLNGEGGHRRLNVAITRARSELLVFASLRPEQIDLGRTGAKGVVDFKHFLEFAEHGARAIAEAFSPTGRGTESAFEDGVMRALEDKGWKIHPQVGVSFFRVDLGVVHPDFPGRYLAGVECDGATYHRSATARDRDRLRELVLTNLGWRIRRIWSTEWWMDAASAAEKIHTRLNADLAADRASRPAMAKPEDTAIAEPSEFDEALVTAIDGVEGSAAASPAQVPARPAAAIVTEPLALAPERANDSKPVEEPKVYARGPAPADMAAIPDIYVKADPSHVVAPDRDRFYEVGYRSDIRGMIDHVVALEAPIYLDVLIDRIARAHGFQRSGETVQRIIRAALGLYRFPSTKDGDREVIWHKGAKTGRKTPYRGAGGREHGDVPLPELAGLADVLRTQGLEDEEDLIRGIQEHFGLGRLAISTRQRFEAAIISAEG